MKITFHGAGCAINLTKDNSYFLLEDGKNNLQVDCGGGLGLAQKINRKEIYFENIFITHKHTDHLLGFFHLIRLIRNGKIEKLNVYCSSEVEKTIKGVIDIMYIKSGIKALNEGRIVFINIDNKQKLNIGDFEIEPINLNSTKIEQYGFLLNLNDKKILFFGDEAIGILGRNDLEKFDGADYLICEAHSPEFMSIENGGKIDNKKICHITARDAGKIGKKLSAKNIILIHTLEDIPGDREKLLKEDVLKDFGGNVIIPNQGDIIEL